MQRHDEPLLRRQTFHGEAQPLGPLGRGDFGIGIGLIAAGTSNANSSGASTARGRRVTRSQCLTTSVRSHAGNAAGSRNSFRVQMRLEKCFLRRVAGEFDFAAAS